MRLLRITVVEGKGHAAHICWANAAMVLLLAMLLSAAVGVTGRYVLAGDFSVSTLSVCAALPLAALAGCIWRARLAARATMPN